MVIRERDGGKRFEGDLVELVDEHIGVVGCLLGENST